MISKIIHMMMCHRYHGTLIFTNIVVCILQHDDSICIEIHLFNNMVVCCIDMGAEYESCISTVVYHQYHDVLYHDDYLRLPRYEADHISRLRGEKGDSEHPGT